MNDSSRGSGGPANGLSKAALPIHMLYSKKMFLDG
jgi:hypothetical protein